MHSIPLFKVFMSEAVLEPVNQVLMSGFVGQGQQVELFENKLRQFFNNELLLTLNSATSAIHLALHLLKRGSDQWPGLKEGDEVLTSPLTCVATNFPILANDLDIQWVDVSADNCNMDLDDLEAKLSPKTKVIMLVHWGGYPHDLDKVKRIQKKCKDLYGFEPAVIEDCAHGFGTKYKQEYLGNHGNICVYSLQATKIFSTVDGGILVLPEEGLFSRGKLLRWYGISRDIEVRGQGDDDIEEWGYKFHMNDLNATIGVHNMKPALEAAEKYKENSDFYDVSLNGVEGVTLLKRDLWAESASWLYTMHVERREDFSRKMLELSISVSSVHGRNDRHSCVSNFKTRLPQLDQVSNTMICIPNGWWVNEEERSHIVDCIKSGW